jgi:hypothetical protein
LAERLQILDDIPALEVAESARNREPSQFPVSAVPAKSGHENRGAVALRRDGISGARVVQAPQQTVRACQFLWSIQPVGPPFFAHANPSVIGAV